VRERRCEAQRQAGEWSALGQLGQLGPFGRLGSQQPSYRGLHESPNPSRSSVEPSQPRVGQADPRLSAHFPGTTDRPEEAILRNELGGLGIAAGTYTTQVACAFPNPDGTGFVISNLPRGAVHYGDHPLAFELKVSRLL